ncbi:MAG: hypothetical protein Q8L60_04585 [Gammaproteobacteria bacterium]|nr:hypothetical protein [Gammaproteobacteria bacterium]MDP2140415.1 hypothetical protein [Gammaproteobacteria bacterium]MDP2349454.1 hypothetical protein [Gammaproteobacteria bacterium]
MSRKTRKNKPTSVLAMCATVGFFIGVGLGALMNNLLLVMFIVVAISCAVGYQIDKKNGITYGRRH